MGVKGWATGSKELKKKGTREAEKTIELRDHGKIQQGAGKK